jgi:predicted methyltransferase
MKRLNFLLAASAMTICTAPILAAAAPAASAAIEKAIADPARPATDTSRDAGRKPAEVVAWAGIKPGMKVVDLLPGGGYFTRIFARTVGDNGIVYAYFGTQYDARLKTQGKDPDNQFADLKATYRNLHVIHGPLPEFVTPEPVDLVWTSDNYHDMHNKAYNMDVNAVNKHIYDSLRPGGFYIVIDHRAAKGAGAGVTESLHRMDEDIAKEEIKAAGFKLVAEGKVLTNPSDDDTKRVFEAGEHDHTDQFMLKFQKPKK